VAKKKQKKSKEAKAAKPEATTKLPKHIAGIKVPKELREPGGKLLEAVRHPLVMDVAAAALIAAAAGLRKGSPSAGTGTTAGKAAPALGALLTATALEGVRRLGDAAARKGNGSAPDAAKSDGNAG
jgi:hypothetical protein